jgi:hypothetical protein
LLERAAIAEAAAAAALRDKAAAAAALVDQAAALAGVQEVVAGLTAELDSAKASAASRLAIPSGPAQSLLWSRSYLEMLARGSAGEQQRGGRLLIAERRPAAPVRQASIAVAVEAPTPMTPPVTPPAPAAAVLVVPAAPPPPPRPARLSRFDSSRFVDAHDQRRALLAARLSSVSPDAELVATQVGVLVGALTDSATAAMQAARSAAIAAEAAAEQSRVIAARPPPVPIVGAAGQTVVRVLVGETPTQTGEEAAGAKEEALCAHFEGRSTYGRRGNEPCAACAHAAGSRSALSRPSATSRVVADGTSIVATFQETSDADARSARSRSRSSRITVHVSPSMRASVIGGQEAKHASGHSGRGAARAWVPPGTAQQPKVARPAAGAPFLQDVVIVVPPNASTHLPQATAVRAAYHLLKAAAAGANGADSAAERSVTSAVDTSLARALLGSSAARPRRTAIHVDADTRGTDARYGAQGGERGAPLHETVRLSPVRPAASPSHQRLAPWVSPPPVSSAMRLSKILGELDEYVEERALRTS